MLQVVGAEHMPAFEACARRAISHHGNDASPLMMKANDPCFNCEVRVLALGKGFHVVWLKTWYNELYSQ